MITQRKLIAAISLCATVAIPNIASAVAVSGQGTWETTLQGRDLDGNPSTVEAYYDTSLNITWLADANYGAGSAYDDIGTNIFNNDTTTDGRMTWGNAIAWAANLNINGYTGWRLPMMTDTGAPGCDVAYSGTDCGWNVDTTTSEMAHMYYVTLGNLGKYDTSGNINYYIPHPGPANTGPFANLLAPPPYSWWSSLEYAPNTSDAWGFNFDEGYQNRANKTMYSNYVWAVHTGDIGAVPLPAAAWLFGSGLLGLIGVARTKAA